MKLPSSSKCYGNNFIIKECLKPAVKFIQIINENIKSLLSNWHSYTLEYVLFIHLLIC